MHCIIYLYVTNYIHYSKLKFHVGIIRSYQKVLLRNESTSSGFRVTRHGYVYDENPNQVSESDRKITQGEIYFGVLFYFSNNVTYLFFLFKNT